MVQRNLSYLFKSKVLFLRSSLSSLYFGIVLSIGQSNNCCQTNPFYASKEKPELIKLTGIALVKLKSIVEHYALLIKGLKSVYFRKSKIVSNFHPILISKVIKDACCIIMPPWKKNNLNK